MVMQIVVAVLCGLAIAFGLWRISARIERSSSLRGVGVDLIVQRDPLTVGVGATTLSDADIAEISLRAREEIVARGGVIDQKFPLSFRVRVSRASLDPVIALQPVIRGGAPLRLNFELMVKGEGLERPHYTDYLLGRSTGDMFAYVAPKLRSKVIEYYRRHLDEVV